eukprot:TRINITY_DN4143_c0_g1_i2.p1 TRINITY_DN4143_c0_g1~~TRINITY_DN4143_c0_g1_i2.p1  ORF type:complete len:123 (-),score=42.46 TRINITY_DN4143_c0_g1_i2:65-433(-)
MPQGKVKKIKPREEKKPYDKPKKTKSEPEPIHIKLAKKHFNKIESGLEKSIIQRAKKSGNKLSILSAEPETSQAKKVSRKKKLAMKDAERRAEILAELEEKKKREEEQPVNFDDDDAEDDDD